MLRQRLLTAAVAIPIVVAVVALAPSAVLGGLMAIAAWVGAGELCRLAAAHGLTSYAGLAAGLSALAALVPAAPRPAETVPAALALSVLAVLTRALVAREPLERVLPSAAVTVLAIAWIGFALGHVTALHRLEAGRALVFTLLLAVWGADSGAYLAGRALGRHKLAPRVSPAKTVEGLAGGVLGSVAGVAAGKLALGVALGWAGVAVLGLVLALASVAGDLVESAVKRGAGVKDSGGLFPGHGGVLDRLDSLMFAAPVMYHWTRLGPPL